MTHFKRSPPADRIVTKEKIDSARLVTSGLEVPQTLGQLRLVHWMTGMGSALTLMQAPEREANEREVSESRWGYGDKEIDLLNGI